MDKLSKECVCLGETSSCVGFYEEVTMPFDVIVFNSRRAGNILVTNAINY